MAVTSSPSEIELRRIQDLLERGHFVEALAAAETIARLEPENRDVLYVQAVSHRCLNDIPAAIAILQALEARYPRFSRLYQERGHCYVLLKDAPRAIKAYLIAVNMNPALPVSWARLERLYRMTGEQNSSASAAAHVAMLDALPQEVVNATSLFSDGDLAPAEQILRAYLLEHGNHIEAMRLLARIGIARKVFDDAEILLKAVLERAPNYILARIEFAGVLLDRHKYQSAREQLEILLKIDPNNRQYQTLFANTCVGLGEHAKAIVLYRKLLADAPRAAELHLSLAHSLKTLGKRDESIASYQAAATIRSDFGDAYWSLANLKTYQFSDREIETMRSAEAALEIPQIDRYHLCFALGKALEDRTQYEESFRYYERGNLLKATETQYRPEAIELNARLQIQTCTREFFERLSNVGNKSAAPIFIVGLPRSGSTLIEQILASHSQVEGTQELAEIPRIVANFQGHDADLANPRYPAVLSTLHPDDFQKLGEKYLLDTLAYRSGSTHFIDKMPNNFRHIALIHLVLPNARIIDARREPMACCFSNLKQLFASGQEFTYSIADIARYYRTYLDLMQHWDTVLPGKVLRVLHEDVVDDLERNIRRILDFCGLDFEPACIDFHKNERSVRTASSEQVRQPIFRGGLDQWKHYEPWLQPLKETLGDALTRFSC